MPINDVFSCLQTVLRNSPSPPSRVYNIIFDIFKCYHIENRIYIYWRPEHCDTFISVSFQWQKELCRIIACAHNRIKYVLSITRRYRSAQCDEQFHDFHFPYKIKCIRDTDFGRRQLTTITSNRNDILYIPTDLCIPIRRYATSSSRRDLGEPNRLRKGLPSVSPNWTSRFYFEKCLTHRVVFSIALFI